MKVKKSKFEIYNEYFNEPQENIDLIMKSIKIKNELFNRNLIPQL